MSTFPPDGWSMGSGVWGTNGNVFSTPEPVSGDVCVGLTGTSIGMVSDYFPVVGGRTYKVDTIVRAENTTNQLTLFIWWFTKSGSFISSSSVLSGTLAAGNTWYSKGKYVFAPTTARFGYAFYAATTTTGTYAYFDNVTVQLSTTWFSAYRSSNVAIATSDETTVVFDTETDIAGVYNNSTGVFTAPHFGRYCLWASNGWASALADGTRYYICMRRNGSYIAQEEHTAGASSSPMPHVTSGPIELEQGDTIDVRVFHAHGSNRNLEGDIASTWFRGVEL